MILDRFRQIYPMIRHSPQALGYSGSFLFGQLVLFSSLYIEVKSRSPTDEPKNHTIKPQITSLFLRSYPIFSSLIKGYHRHRRPTEGFCRILQSNIRGLYGHYFLKCQNSLRRFELQERDSYFPSSCVSSSSIHFCRF